MVIVTEQNDHWFAIIILTITTFIMITTEFAPIGLLSQISLALQSEISTVSLSVTLYAVFGAGFGLLASCYFYCFERKVMLIVLNLLMALSNLFAASAHSIEVLFLARVFGSGAHGIYWAIVADYATKLVTRENIGKATSLVFAGISTAFIVGVPLVNYIGTKAGWKMPFYGMAIIGFILSVLMFIFLPNCKTQQNAKPLSFNFLKNNSNVLILFLVIGLIAAAHFGSYTFIEPYVKNLEGYTMQNMVLILLLYGVAGLIGNLVAVVIMDRFIERLIFVSAVIMAGIIFFLFIYGNKLNVTINVIPIFIWGIVISILFTGLQTWVIKISGDYSSSAAAIASASLNFSIGIGTIIGAVLEKYYGLQMVFLMSATFCLICVFFISRIKQ